MKRIIICILQLYVSHLFAQYSFFSPKDAFAIEVSMENTSLKRMPAYRNSIASLTVSGDFIIGGTSADRGLSPFLFTASLSKRKMQNMVDMGSNIPGQREIRTGFCKLNENTFYAGTIPDDEPGGEKPGGHLISVSVDVSGNLLVSDLGVPIPGEGIYSLTIDDKKNNLYGITYPSGVFFSYSVKTGKVISYPNIMPSNKEKALFAEFLLNPTDYLCDALIVVENGMVLGSAPVNRIFSFNPVTRTFEYYNQEIPDVWGRRSLGKIECWVKGANGELYAGNAGDGQLLEIDPVSKTIKNLGKPIMMPRIRGLALSYNGKLFGIAGALPGYAHLFSYDPVKYGFKDFGNPQFTMKAPGIEQGIEWRGFQLRTITASEDGKYMIMGEDETLSQLMVFPVDAAHN